MSGSGHLPVALRRHLWVAAAVVLVVGGIGAVTIGLQGQSHALPAPSPSVAARKAVVDLPRVATALATARSSPLTLRIPAIGLSVAVGTLGLNADGTVQVPSGTRQPGWFDRGPTPGQIGSAVLLGHVDSYQGPGIFGSPDRSVGRSRSPLAAR